MRGTGYAGYSMLRLTCCALAADTQRFKHVPPAITAVCSSFIARHALVPMCFGRDDLAAHLPPTHGAGG